jgi:hypothetical protein
MFDFVERSNAASLCEFALQPLQSFTSAISGIIRFTDITVLCADSCIIQNSVIEIKK